MRKVPTSNELLYRTIRKAVAQRPKHPGRKTIREVAALALSAGISFHDMEMRVTEEMVLQSYLQFRGNQCAAARELRMHRNTFYRRLFHWMQSNNIPPGPPRFNRWKVRDESR